MSGPGIPSLDGPLDEERLRVSLMLPQDDGDGCLPRRFAWNNERRFVAAETFPDVGKFEQTLEFLLTSSEHDISGSGLIRLAGSDCQGTVVDCRLAGSKKLRAKRIPTSRGSSPMSHSEDLRRGSDRC